MIDRIRTTRENHDPLARASLAKKLPSQRWSLSVATMAVIEPMKTSERQQRRAISLHGPLRYRTHQVAALAGVTSRTVYNWLKDGRLAPEQGPNGYRLWTAQDVVRAMQLGAAATNRGRRKRDA